MYTGTLILYTNVTSIHYELLPRKDTTWKIHVNNLSVRSLQGLLLLFLVNCNGFGNKNEEFYNPSVKNFVVKLMVCLSTVCGCISGLRYLSRDEKTFLQRKP